MTSKPTGSTCAIFLTPQVCQTFHCLFPHLSLQFLIPRQFQVSSFQTSGNSTTKQHADWESNSVTANVSVMPYYYTNVLLCTHNKLNMIQSVCYKYINIQHCSMIDRERESISVIMYWKSVSTISHKSLMGISSDLQLQCSREKDELIIFWCKKVKGQCRS